MVMKWIDDSDRQAIYASATQVYEKEILDLAENIAEGNPLQDLDQFAPDQIINALLLIVSHFDGGQDFYEEELSVFEQAMVSHQIGVVVAMNAKLAASESHRGEADEQLRDSE